MATILLARHGESDWNAARRWQGHADRPLSDLGRAQARTLAERLARIRLDAIYSSDLRRARDTAVVVGKSQGLSVRLLRELREVDVGSWSGLTMDEAAERFPEGFGRWLGGAEGWDDGETYPQLAARVVPAVLRLATAHTEGRVLVVAHGGTIRAVHAAALGVDIGAYRRLRPVEPNARLSSVCVVDGALTELCSAGRLDELLARDQEEHSAAAARPPTPAG